MLAESDHPISPKHGTSPMVSPGNYGVKSPYDQDDLDLANLLQVARRRKWAIATVALATTSGIWGWTLTRTPIFQGQFEMLVESVAEADPSQQLLQGNSVQLQASFDYETQIQVLRSPALLEPIVERLQPTLPGITYQALASNLVITRVRETKVLSISYRDPDPAKIEAILNEVSESYLQYSFDQRQASLQQGVDFVDEQLPQLQARVDTLQRSLEDFRQRYSLINPESRGEDLSRLITSVEEQRQVTQTQLSEARSLYNALQTQLGLNPSEALAASALSESARYQSLLNEIRELEAEIAAESARFQPDVPQIQVLEDRRDSLIPVLEQEAERILGSNLPNGLSSDLTSISLDLSRQLVNTANEVQVLQARSEALVEVENALKGEFDAVPALAREYTELQRELTIATESLNRFLETRETLQIDAAQSSVPWQLISQPSVLGSPISPNVSRNLTLGVIAGLMLGAGAALVREKLDQVFHTPEELKIFTRLPMLGIVPFDQKLRGSESNASESPTVSDVLNHQHQQGYHTSPFLESFRSLYTNLRFLASDQPIRSVVISSAAPAEGKSTTAIYLARSAAIMGQRILLVDADLRLPQVHTRLNLPNLQGLSNVIASELDWREALQVSSVDENLSVLTAGAIPPDPIKLLSSRKMQQFMDEVQRDFDLVIFDMPPLLGFADSNLLAAQTDGMIMVVGLGKTSHVELKQAIDTLEVSPVSILGLVANGIRQYTTRSYGYNRYHRYYSKQAAQQAQTEVGNQPLPVENSAKASEFLPEVTPSEMDEFFAYSHSLEDSNPDFTDDPDLLTEDLQPLSSDEYPDDLREGESNNNHHNHAEDVQFLTPELRFDGLEPGIDENDLTDLPESFSDLVSDRPVDSSLVNIPDLHDRLSGGDDFYTTHLEDFGDLDDGGDRQNGSDISDRILDKFLEDPPDFVVDDDDYFDDTVDETVIARDSEDQRDEDEPRVDDSNQKGTPFSEVWQHFIGRMGLGALLGHHSDAETTDPDELDERSDQPSDELEAADEESDDVESDDVDQETDLDDTTFLMVDEPDAEIIPEERRSPALDPETASLTQMPPIAPSIESTDSQAPNDVPTLQDPADVPETTDTQDGESGAVDPEGDRADHDPALDITHTGRPDEVTQDEAIAQTSLTPPSTTSDPTGFDPSENENHPPSQEPWTEINRITDTDSTDPVLDNHLDFDDAEFDDPPYLDAEIDDEDLELDLETSGLEGIVEELVDTVISSEFAILAAQSSDSPASETGTETAEPLATESQKFPAEITAETGSAPDPAAPQSHLEPMESTPDAWVDPRTTATDDSLIPDDVAPLLEPVVAEDYPIAKITESELETEPLMPASDIEPLPDPIGTDLTNYEPTRDEAAAREPQITGDGVQSVGSDPRQTVNEAQTLVGLGQGRSPFADTPEASHAETEQHSVDQDQSIDDHTTVSGEHFNPVHSVTQEQQQRNGQQLVSTPIQESVDSDAYFEEAVLTAQSAISAGESARTLNDWRSLAAQWRYASDLMGQVSHNHDNYEIAQRCQILYRNNSYYAQQKANQAMEEGR